MGDRFATTQWSLVLAARDGTDSQARGALAFFADLLGRDFLDRIDRSKGRSDLVIHATRIYSVAGLYELPWGVNLSGAVYGRQGYPTVETITINRPDGLGQTPVLVDREIDAGRFENLHLVDLRLQKTFPFGSAKATLDFDIFNVSNTAVVLRQFREATATTFRRPQENRRATPDPARIAGTVLTVASGVQERYGARRSVGTLAGRASPAPRRYRLRAAEAEIGRRLATPPFRQERPEQRHAYDVETHEHRRKPFVVRLGEQLLPKLIEETFFLREVGDADGEDAWIRHARLLRLHPLHPHPRKPLQLALLADPERKMIERLFYTGQ